MSDGRTRAESEKVWRFARAEMASLIGLLRAAETKATMLERRETLHKIKDAIESAQRDAQTIEGLSRLRN